jgi:hypothetical protein
MRLRSKLRVAFGGRSGRTLSRLPQVGAVLLVTERGRGWATEQALDSGYTAAAAVAAAQAASVLYWLLRKRGEMEALTAYARSRTRPMRKLEDRARHAGAMHTDGERTPICESNVMCAGWASVGRCRPSGIGRLRGRSCPIARGNELKRVRGRARARASRAALVQATPAALAQRRGSISAKCRAHSTSAVQPLAASQPLHPVLFRGCTSCQRPDV